MANAVRRLFLVKVLPRPKDFGKPSVASTSGEYQMPSAQNSSSNGGVITMYAPIFREKLERLERGGKGYCEEALGIRKALSLIDIAQFTSNGERDTNPILIAAE